MRLRNTKYPSNPANKPGIITTAAIDRGKSEKGRQNPGSSVTP